eukprot:gene10882-12096_t
MTSQSLFIAILLLAVCSAWCFVPRCSPRLPISPLCRLGGTSNDDVFGAELAIVQQAHREDTPTNKEKAKTVSRQEVMQEYQNLRSTVFLDSVFVTIVGFSIVWMFGTFKDAISYGLGGALGLCYSVLLGRFVERLGTKQASKATDGLRFVPVVLLVGLYAKYKTDFSLIMELLGFVLSYQVGSFLQMFNPDPYSSSSSDRPS